MQINNQLPVLYILIKTRNKENQSNIAKNQLNYFIIGVFCKTEEFFIFCFILLLDLFTSPIKQYKKLICNKRIKKKKAKAKQIKFIVYCG